MVAGHAQYSTAGDYDFAVARLNPDGSPDMSFGTAGKATVPFDLGGDHFDEAAAVALQPDGRIVVAGSARVSSTDSNFAVRASTPTVCSTRASALPARPP